jgi:hypothetical protein
MLVSMVFGGLAGMMHRVKPMAMRDMRMVRGFLVIPSFVMLGGLAMMSGRMLVVF